MAGYRIHSTAGADHGRWEGDTATDALCAMHREAGYDVMYDAERDCIAWPADPEVRSLCGDVDAWHIERLPEIDPE